MSIASNYFPFFIDNDAVTEEWSVVLEDPDNKDNFVVAYRSKSFEDCCAINDSLNNLIQKHFNKVIEKNFSEREARLKDLGFEELTEDQLANIQLGRNLT